jgi:hypothetical protein
MKRLKKLLLFILGLFIFTAPILLLAGMFSHPMWLLWFVLALILIVPVFYLFVLMYAIALIIYSMVASILN